MAGFSVSHLDQYGLTNNGAFLFCHGGHGAGANPEDAAVAAAQLETSSLVLGAPPPWATAASVEIKKRKPREESASLTSAHSKDSKEISRKRGGKKQSKAIEEEEEEEPKGYIHVRARRGQATDSHSLSERVRRERISERMKMLQSLVPGCDKVTGKALVLDEIINYVQSLQNQVEFLSMRIASLSPVLYGFDMDTTDAAFSDHSHKINEGMFQEGGAAMHTPAAMNRSASPAVPSQAIMDTSNSSPPPCSLQAHGCTSLSQDNGSNSNSNSSSSYMMQTVGAGEEPRQELFNQVVFSNYMCSFQ